MTANQEAAFDFLRKNPETRKEELSVMFELTLEDSASVIDAFDCWNTPWEA